LKIVRIHPCGGKELYSAEGHIDGIKITKERVEILKNYFKVLLSPDNQFMMLETGRSCRILVFSTGRVVVRMANSEKDVKRYLKIIEGVLTK